MELVRTKTDLQRIRGTYDSTTVVGLVPTMGNLHEGHLRLIDAAKSKCTRVFATIFVNPLQFGPQEDFDSYPRVVEQDSELLSARGVDLLFAPAMDEMYPRGRDGHTNVSISHLTNMLCGASRPGHFDGVATVVSKLFHIVQPQIAFFGEKDWQQLTLIRTMVEDLDIPVQIVGVPTVRDERGLALSSRNGYLNVDERQRAPLLYATLMRIQEQVLNGNTRYKQLEKEACSSLANSGFVPDYVSIREGNTLQCATVESTDRRVFGAAYLGNARLIDNIPIDV